MYPIILDLGAWGLLPSWHLFYFLAAVLCLFSALKLNRYIGQGITPPYDKSVIEIFQIGYLGGYFGARVFAILVEEPALRDALDLLSRLISFGPMTFYGGMIGAFLAAWLFATWRQFPRAKLADLFFPSGILALSVGRIGCFLNGDDYGIPVFISPTSEIPWWAVVFPNHADPVPRVPIQLIESAGCIGIYFLCLWISTTKRNNRLNRLLQNPGNTAAVCCYLYAMVRFVLEYFRDDPRGAITLGTFSPSQIVCIIILASSVAWLVFSGPSATNPKDSADSSPAYPAN